MRWTDESERDSAVIEDVILVRLRHSAWMYLIMVADWWKTLITPMAVWPIPMKNSSICVGVTITNTHYWQMCASPCGELGVGTRASPMRVRPCPKQLQECKLQGSSNLNHRQVSGPSKTRRNFTSEILEKKGVGNGGNVTDVHMPLHSVFFIRDTVKFWLVVSHKFFLHIY